jgi:hypothetical protein
MAHYIFIRISFKLKKRMTPQELGNIKPKKLNLKKLKKGKPWDDNSTMDELGEMENASIFLPIILFTKLCNT